jgi:hypothetical protein
MLEIFFVVANQTCKMKYVTTYDVISRLHIDQYYVVFSIYMYILQSCLLIVNCFTRFTKKFIIMIVYFIMFYCSLDDEIEPF